jgi:hypothetical protein
MIKSWKQFNEISGTNTYEVGDYIKCIENDGMEDLITVGKTYQVTVVSKFFDALSIIDDTGVQHTFYPEHFTSSVEPDPEVVMEKATADEYDSESAGYDYDYLSNISKIVGVNLMDTSVSRNSYFGDVYYSYLSQSYSEDHHPFILYRDIDISKPKPVSIFYRDENNPLWNTELKYPKKLYNELEKWYNSLEKDPEINI